MPRRSRTSHLWHPQRVSVRLLSATHTSKAETLAPAVARWAKQFGAARPLRARLTAPPALHDGLILVDGADVWALSQSPKDFANRSPAFVQKVDATIAAMKVAHYEATWAAGTPLSNN